MPYDYIDVVARGLNAANSRTPRMMTSAIKEYGRMLSDMVAAGDWIRDGDEMLTAAGQNEEQFLDFLINNPENPRPHWLVPATTVDKADDTWTSGDLTKQGKRWRELRAFLGSDAATDAACNAEAGLYNTKMGSTIKGHKPGTKAADDQHVGASNPYSDAYVKRHGIEAARLERGRIMTSPLGIKGATKLAAAAGYSVTGVKLRT